MKWVLFGPLVLRVAAAGVVVAIVAIATPPGRGGMMMHHLAFVHRFWNLYLPLDRLGFLHIVAVLGFFIILGHRTATTASPIATRDGGSCCSSQPAS